MSKKRSFWRITCNDAALICNKSQYKESSFLEKVKLNLHIISCKVCKQFVKQNSLLSKIFKQQTTLCKEEYFKMSFEDKEALKEELKNASL